MSRKSGAVEAGIFDKMVSAYSQWRAALSLANQGDRQAAAQAEKLWKQIAQMRQLLEDLGYKVTEAELRKQGLAKYRQFLTNERSDPSTLEFEKKPALIPIKAKPAMDMVGGHLLKAEQLVYDFVYWAEHSLHIPYRPRLSLGDKRSGPFILNSAQQKLIALCVEILLVERKPLRVIVLKSRQLGCTTLMLAFYLWLAIRFKHIRILVIIDKGDHVINKRLMLLEWINALQDKIGAVWPEELPTIISLAGEQIVLSNGSVFMFESATAENPGTSEMITGLHESEKPKWRPGRAALVRDSVTPGLPRAPMTIHVNESTALGMEQFYDEFMAAMESSDPDGVIPLFLAWMLSDEYYKQPTALHCDAQGNFIYLDDDRLWDEDPETGKLLTEKEYSKKYKLTPGQTLWRRTTILDPMMFNGNRASFDQEYPTTPGHAFRKSSNMFFPVDTMMRVRPVTPVAVGRMVDLHLGNAVIGTQYDTVHPEMVVDREGPLAIFEHPIPGVTYFLGGDTASGKAALKPDGKFDPDKSVLYVEREDGVCVARFRGEIRPEDLWWPLLLLAVYYNMAWVNVERNKGGEALLPFFYLTGYQNNYLSPVPENSLRPVKDRMWLDVTKSSRDPLLADLRASWTQHPRRLTDEVTFGEAKKFVQNHVTGKAEAQSGYHDDCVLAAAHCEFVRIWVLGLEEASKLSPIKTVIDEVPTFSDRDPLEYRLDEMVNDSVDDDEGGFRYGW